jgi:hypothetical protein
MCSEVTYARYEDNTEYNALCSRLKLREPNVSQDDTIPYCIGNLPEGQPPKFGTLHPDTTDASRITNCDVQT